MVATSYPGLAAHQIMHRDFVERAHSFTDASLADAAPFDEMLGFLLGWLASHISHEDTRFARHVAGLG